MVAEVPNKDDKKSVPAFKPGDTLRIHLKVVEGESERIQVFEGIVIRRRGSGISETFTVRKVSFGVGVERTFPLLSPRIARVELARSGRARRARLYYLRGLQGKAARLSEDTRGQSVAQAQGAASGSSPADAASGRTTESAAGGRGSRVETAPAA